MPSYSFDQQGNPARLEPLPFAPKRLMLQGA
jgi:hypothetical protein